MKSTTPAVKIKAEVMWAYLTRINNMSGRYQVDLCNLSDKAVQALEDLGIEVKTKEGKGKFITCKSTLPINAYDDGGSQIDGSILGNGSKATALVSCYSWKKNGKQGVSPSLKRIVITNLVPYVPTTEETFEDDDVL